MTQIKATILVEPIGKARPRFRQFNDKGKARVMTYTPEKTRNAQLLIQASIRNLVYARGHFSPEVAVRLEATFFRSRPKQLPKRITMPLTKPDWDNYGKLVSDALEKFVYRSDSQITTCLIKKRFGDPPRIEILLDEDNGD